MDTKLPCSHEKLFSNISLWDYGIMYNLCSATVLTVNVGKHEEKFEHYSTTVRYFFHRDNFLFLFVCFLFQNLFYSLLSHTYLLISY